MRYVNENYETIEKPEHPDLNEYEIYEEIIIRESAIPPDNITKFAYADEDYETVTVIRKIPKVEKIRKDIDNYKRYLSNTDYVVIKLAEGATTKEEYTDIMFNRRKCRKLINELEEELNGLVSSN